MNVELKYNREDFLKDVSAEVSEIIEETNAPSSIGDVTAKPKNISYYRRALTQKLSPEIFKPNPLRLLWYLGCITILGASFFAVVHLQLVWPVKLAIGIVVGFCNAALAFISHEIFHGSVVRNQNVQNILGFFGGIPFLVSPTFWKFWHNRLHHGKTQQLINDPDAFPNLRIYRASKFVQNMFPFTPGSGTKRSYFYFFFWFSFHNFVAQSYLRFRNEIFSSLNQRQVTIEFTSLILIVIGLMIFAGPANWLWLFVIPFVIQNYILMSYISTNHNLNPLTKENDPLENSLSVTNNPVLEFLNFNFGYHVEHHIYPTVSGKYAKQIHRELLKQFPSSYHVMTKWQAIKALYSTPRIYKNAHEFINPKTLVTRPTLGS